jgi:Fis family transcriptional regulator
MTKTVLQKSKNKPLSEQVRKAMKKYFATLGDAAPANIYEMVMTEVEPELLKAVMKYANYNQSKAANVLGLNRATLRKKLHRYSIIEKS